MFEFLFKSKNENNYDESDVVVGSRYFQVGGTERKWIIQRVFKPAVSDVPHAVMVREGSEHTNKMVSISALMDPSIFRPERRDDHKSGVERENKARRRSDTKVSR